MTYRQRIICAAVVLVLAVAVFMLWAVNRKARLERAMPPAWLNRGQPPDGIAAELTTLTDDQSWAANRARHMSACCAGRTAGMRVRRTYPATLAESGCSIVRGRVALELGLGA